VSPTQRENALFVCIREKGDPELTFQVSPSEEADHHIKRIETELIARAAFNQCDGCPQ
jgi:hypothetical protein